MSKKVRSGMVKVKQSNSNKTESGCKFGTHKTTDYKVTKSKSHKPNDSIIKIKKPKKVKVETEKTAWSLRATKDSEFSRVEKTKSYLDIEGFVKKIKIKKRSKKWSVWSRQTSAYSKVVENKDIVKCKIVTIEDRVALITGTPWYTRLPILLFLTVSSLLFFFLSIDILMIQDFGARTDLNMTETVFFLLLKTTTMVSLLLAFTKFRNSNTKFIILIWISFIASLFSSWIGNRDFYLFVSIGFIILMSSLYGINKIRDNPPIKEKFNVLTIAIMFMSVIVIVVGTIFGGYLMNWIPPNSDAHIENENLVAMIISFLLVGIILTTLKRPSGVFLIWFGIFFSVLSTIASGFYMGMTAGIILLPIIILMFIEWQDVNFTKKAINNPRISSFYL